MTGKNRYQFTGKARRLTSRTAYVSMILLGMLFIFLAEFYGYDGISTIGTTLFIVGFVAILMFWNTSGAVGELKEEMAGGFKELKEEMAGGFKELKEEMAGGFKELKEEMAGGFKELKEEMAENTKELKEHSDKNFEKTNDILMQILEELKRLNRR